MTGPRVAHRVRAGTIGRRLARELAPDPGHVRIDAREVARRLVAPACAVPTLAERRLDDELWELLGLPEPAWIRASLLEHPAPGFAVVREAAPCVGSLAVDIFEPVPLSSSQLFVELRAEPSAVIVRALDAGARAVGAALAVDRADLVACVVLDGGEEATLSVSRPLDGAALDAFLRRLLGLGAGPELVPTASDLFDRRASFPRVRSRESTTASDGPTGADRATATDGERSSPSPHALAAGRPTNAPLAGSPAPRFLPTVSPASIDAPPLRRPTATDERDAAAAATEPVPTPPGSPLVPRGLEQPTRDVADARTADPGLAKPADAPPGLQVEERWRTPRSGQITSVPAQSAPPTGAPRSPQPATAGRPDAGSFGADVREVSSGSATATANTPGRPTLHDKSSISTVRVAEAAAEMPSSPPSAAIASSDRASADPLAVRTIDPPTLPPELRRPARPTADSAASVAPPAAQPPGARSPAAAREPRRSLRWLTHLFADPDAAQPPATETKGAATRLLAAGRAASVRPAAPPPTLRPPRDRTLDDIEVDLSAELERVETVQDRPGLVSPGERRSLAVGDLLQMIPPSLRLGGTL